MKGTTLANIALGGIAVAIGSALITVNVISLVRNRRVRGY